MLSLYRLADFLTRIDAELFGEVVRDSARRLEVLAVSGAKDHFREQRAPDGTPWKPLAHPRPNGGDRVLRDKGLLMASLSASVTQGQLLLKASHPGANVHQFGAIIRPKSAKRLAIPISREGKRAGRPRDFPRPLSIMGVSGATAFLGEEKGKRVKTIVYHYVLVREAKVPKREFAGFSAETLGKIAYVLASDFDAKLIAKMERARDDYNAANPIIQ